MSTPINNATQQLTSPTNSFSLRTLLDSHKDSTAISINCHHIGTIESFDATDQTATASINYTKTFFQYNAQTNDTSPVQVNYPMLMKCPVICLGGGSTSLTFPIKKGDECLILFNDRSLDNWFQSGQVGPVNSPRLHSISDGIILVGLRSSQNVLSSYSSTHAVIQNKVGAQVGVNETTALALIKGGSGTLGMALQNFCSACSSSSDGTLVSAAAALSTALGGILE